VPPSPRRIRRSPSSPEDLQRHFDRSDLSPTSTTGWSADGARLALVRLSPPVVLSLLSRSPTPPRLMRQPRRSGVGASRVSRQGKCLACCLQSSNVLAGLPPHPRSAWPQQAFPDPGFQDGSGTPDDFHQHQPERPHGRPHASHSERLLEGALIRFSYQGGFGLASNAPGCASSPLHPCDVTVTSPDCGSSPVRPLRAAPWQGLHTCSPVDRLTGHLLPAAMCPRRPHLHGLVS
jgi:hypothetical protein